jgi:glycosyltransferase involved in cell wall biosynthesis
MSVMYVLKRYPRLSETFIVRELTELEARGVELSIDALLPPEDGPRHPAVETVAARVRYLPRRPRLRQRDVMAAHLRLCARRPRAWVAQARRARRFGTWRRFLQAGLVADRARREAITSLHAHFATAAVEVAGHAAALAGIPFTVTAHAKDIYTDENAARLGDRVAAAAAVVTVSEHNRAHLGAVLPGTRVEVVRNGVPFASAAATPVDGPILCVARLVEKKGIDLLLRAVADLAPTRPTLRLEIIGGGPLDEYLQALAAEWGIAARVAFRGPQSPVDVESAYAGCAMVVLPCRIGADGDRDGLPTVLVEALARALPVVTTDVVGIGELVEHRKTGLLVPPEDPAALATAIAELLDNPTLGRSLGAAGRTRVRCDYDLSGNARALARIFEGVGA